MKHLLILPLLLLTNCGIPNSEPSCTFIQNSYGQRVSWYYTPVIIGLDPSIPANLQPAVYSAALEWNNSFGRELIRVVNYRTDNMVYMLNTWNHNVYQEAYTNIFWYNNTIYQTNIYVNAAGFQFYYGAGSGIEFKSLMIHEMGHVLGLGHSDGVMYPYLFAGQVRWDIDANIINNLRCEY